MKAHIEIRHAALRTGDVRTKIQDALQCEMSDEERTHLLLIADIVELAWKSLHKMAEVSK